MAKDRILVESFDEAGDAAYRVYAGTRELLFAGCGLALSNLILPAMGEGARTSGPSERHDPIDGDSPICLCNEASSPSIIKVAPGASLTERSFTVSSVDIDLLLANFLSELICLFDSEGFLGYSFDVEFAREPSSGGREWEVVGSSREADSDIRLDVHVRGLTLPASALEPQRAEDRILGLVPKGVSYHMLEVGRGEDGRWGAQFVLDA
ncbi:MAG: archease [Firmicutes bacterium]|nr:archease [Bacillota bacterium]